MAPGRAGLLHLRGPVLGSLFLFAVAGGEEEGVIGSRAFKGGAPLLMTLRNSLAMEQCGSSASARASATDVGQGSLADCQGTKAECR